MNFGTQLLSKALLVQHLCKILDIDLEELRVRYPTHTIELDELILIYKNQYFLKYIDQINESIDEYFQQKDFTQNEFCKYLYYRIVSLDELVEYELKNNLNNSIDLLSLALEEDQYSSKIYILIKIELTKILTNDYTKKQFDRELKIIQNKLNEQ